MTPSDHNVVDLESRGLKYSVRVLIKHPSENLEIITLETGITPKLLATAGTERRAPSGAHLPGLHSVSVWSYWQDIPNSRSFSSGIKSVLTAMTPASATIKRVRDTAGSAQLILALDGTRNIGDVIEVAELSRLLELGFDLGIEVFPNGL